jgi:hypothetical protein
MGIETAGQFLAAKVVRASDLGAAGRFHKFDGGTHDSATKGFTW